MQIFGIDSKTVGEYVPFGKSVYSLFQKTSTEKPHDIALSYFGKEITFKELSDNIDRVASALVSMGVSKGDKVIVSLPSVPQAVELFYAVNKIGAIFCGMDCRSTKEEIAEIFEQINPKLCFVSDFHLKCFTDIEDVPIICISFMKTVNMVASFASVFVELFTGRTLLFAKKKNFMRYGKFFSLSKKCECPQDANVSGNDICAYFYTSGTTYGRKCAVLSNENLNSSVLQYALSQPDIEETDRFCTIMPLFTCYGITLGTHLPLILGKQVRMIPLFTGKNMKKLLLSEKPGYITTVPAHWEHFIKDDFSGVDFSFFKGAIVGGDKLSASAEDKINEIFRKTKSSAKVMRGYGLTEAATAVTCQPADTPKGSVGTHMCWSDIAIFEPGTDSEVPCGEKGEICVCGPNICKGYLGDKEATESLLHRHSDGKIWMHSGDIGYIDKNQFLFFCERIKRIFVRFDGTKMSPFAIEQHLLKCPAVESCMVYAVDDAEHEHGKCPAAFVVFKDEYSPEQGKKIFEEFVSEKLSYHMRPVETSFVSSLPVTRNGKFDYFRARKTT